jgi:hypothetical protein
VGVEGSGRGESDEGEEGWEEHSEWFLRWVVDLK